MNSQDYIEVSIRLRPFSEELSEMLMAELSELPYDSFLIEEPFLKCYIQREDFQPGPLKAVLSGYDEVYGFEAALMPAKNWNRQWEESFTSLVVEGKVTVKSPAAASVPRTRFNIWIDPGMAFGTGSHHTTYMMIQRMLGIESLIRGHNILDMGCGTAVLGILAAKMGARKVFAVDIDAVAARSAWGNARWNRVGSKIETACGDASLLQAGSYDLILANIHRNVLIQDMPTYQRSLRRGGRILLSGFYEQDIPAVLDAAVSCGLHLIGTSLREGWACLECGNDIL